ncbi:MAG: SUMF1/EgtB/PvdO family nonheme iron enzyme, partial [Myxococcota bacterium]
ADDRAGATLTLETARMWLAEPTGSLNTCGSAEGVFDMSGNLAEWTSTPVAREPGSDVLNDRAVRGGSFRSNFSALRCVGEEFRAAPGTLADDIGFRCCAEPG